MNCADRPSQHIELDHAESRAASVPDSASGTPAVAEPGPSRDRQRRRPSRDEDPERRRRTTQHHARSTTVRSSSSQPSVIQAWKELFNHHGGSRSSSRESGSGGGRSSQQRVRHKTKLEGRLREESTSAKSRASTSERGESSTSQDRTKLGVCRFNTRDIDLC